VGTKQYLLPLKLDAFEMRRDVSEDGRAGSDASSQFADG
jgi:hypothetical protein